VFDALHDMGDLLGVARHVHDVLTLDGTWLIVEPETIAGRTTTTGSAGCTCRR
jgi:hypothetical protein